MEFNVSNYLDYRDIIRIASKRQKISYKSLANSCRIHSSYFSRVMTGKADFSQEQLFLIVCDVNLSGWEQEYTLLLGEYASTGNNKHRSYLKAKIDRIREKRQKVVNQLEDIQDITLDQKVEYFQDVVTSMVHVYLTIEKYRKRPQLICGKMGIDEHKLNMIVEKLENWGIIRVEESGEISVLKFNVHLDETDPFLPTYHIMSRLDAASYIGERRKKPSDLHVSVVFSTDEEAKNQIREMFKKFIVSAQKLSVQTKQNEEVFRIRFDLY